MDADYALFAAVIEAGSLSEAGRRLRLSPAMVSKRLARLEARLGARLIHRTTRRLALTDVGAGFHAEVVAILRAAEAAEARVAGRADAPAGPLRISAPTSFGRMHVAPHLAPFLARHPQVELSLDLEDGFVDLIGERIDIAIRIGPPPGSGLSARLLGPNRRVLCAAPDYLAAQGEPQGLADLDRHRLLATRGQMPWRLEGPGGAESVAGESIVATNSSEVVRALVIAGLGVALRSLWDVSEELASGALVRILPQWQGARDIGLHAVHPRGGVPPATVRAFLDYLAELYADPPWEKAQSTR